MKFEIVVDNDDAGAEDGGMPWNAALFAIDADGKSGEVIEVGLGGSPLTAVSSLLEQLPRQWNLCVECGTLLDPYDVHGGHGMCGACLHNAIRSGWEPGVTE